MKYPALFFQPGTSTSRARRLPQRAGEVIGAVALLLVAECCLPAAATAQTQQLGREAPGEALPRIGFRLGPGGVPLVQLTFFTEQGQEVTFEAWCYESTLALEGEPRRNRQGALVLWHRNRREPSMLIQTTVTPAPGRVAFVARAVVDRRRKPQGELGPGLPYLNLCFQQRRARGFRSSPDPYPRFVQRCFIFTRRGRTFLLDTRRRKIPGKPDDHPHNNPPWVQIYTPIWHRPVNKPHWAGYSPDQYVAPVIGTVSRDGKYLVALANQGHCAPDDGLCNAWHDCLHANPSWTPLDASRSEDKRWRLHVYFMRNDPDALLKRVYRDFPQAARLGKR